MIPDGSIPTFVSAARSTDLGRTITGYLFEAELEGFYLVGRIFFDHKHRFRNGRLIRTSAVREFFVEGGYLLAVTYTESVYVLISAEPSLINLKIRGSDESFAFDC